MKLLLLLVLESTRDDAHTFIANVVTAEVQLTDRLTALEDALELMQTLDPDIVLLEREHLKVSLLTQGSA